MRSTCVAGLVLSSIESVITITAPHWIKPKGIQSVLQGARIPAHGDRKGARRKTCSGLLEGNLTQELL